MSIYAYLRSILSQFLNLPYRSSNCRFIPTCSQYCKQAFENKSVHVAIILCMFRVLRCNPLVKGGHDPLT